jgi:hypothetical protein
MAENLLSQLQNLEALPGIGLGPGMELGSNRNFRSWAYHTRWDYNTVRKKARTSPSGAGYASRPLGLAGVKNYEKA